MSETTIDAHAARVDELQKPVGSVSVLASEEGDFGVTDRDDCPNCCGTGTDPFEEQSCPSCGGRGSIPAYDFDYDFDDEPLPARTCAIDGEECELCQ